MAFVSAPKDLNKIKSKLAFNLTFRQLLCFGIAAVIGVPIYLFTRGSIGNSLAALLMIIIMLPLFFLAMFEKDGQPAEMFIRNYIRTRYWPGIRPNKTKNLYEILEKEDLYIAPSNQQTAKTLVDKSNASQRKSV